ncbi:MAG TPA: hypothetical protein VLA13_08660, partial [Massilibacterium sp.]|nr:hypothetical protein [Massilibacterium sp.]
MPKLFKKIPKWLRLPTPKEMGAKSNSLPCRKFSPWTEGYTWEDWEKEVKATYPFKYLVVETLPRKFDVKITMPLQHAYWWLRDKVVTKHHLVDVRQGYNGFDIYRWGYCDPREKILYANFNILKEFIEREKPSRPEEIEEPGHRIAVEEIYSLYKYWMEERVESHKRIMRLSQARQKAVDENNKLLYNSLTDQWREAHELFEVKEQQALER